MRGHTCQRYPQRLALCLCDGTHVAPLIMSSCSYITQITYQRATISCACAMRSCEFSIHVYVFQMDFSLSAEKNLSSSRPKVIVYVPAVKEPLKVRTHEIFLTMGSLWALRWWITSAQDTSLAWSYNRPVHSGLQIVRKYNLAFMSTSMWTFLMATLFVTHTNVFKCEVYLCIYIFKFCRDSYIIYKIKWLSVGNICLYSIEYVKIAS